MTDYDDFGDYILDPDELVDDLIHYGMPRRSGRYPWGSGENPYQSSKSFMGYISSMKEKDPNMTELQIAETLGMNSREFREQKRIARAEILHHNVIQVENLKYGDNPWSNTAISEHLGIPESTVRSLLKPGAKERALRLNVVADRLEDELKNNKFLDVGTGVEQRINVSREQLRTAITMLENKGYELHTIYIPQVTMPDQNTTMNILVPAGTTKDEIYKNLDKIGTIDGHLDDGGTNWKRIHAPENIDSKRIGIVYGDEGGSENDGLIKIRPGVSDLDMGSSDYAQVRIAVDGTHYLKGVAVYDSDIPKGKDILFHTNKSKTSDPHDAMKAQETKSDGTIDKDNPFGAYLSRQNGALNVVYEEGDWSEWDSKLASQVLSKQSTVLAKQQLGSLLADRQAEYDEIVSLTNPVVKKHLLQKFADSVDSDAVELQAAAMPRQTTNVIIPINSLKAPTEGKDGKPGRPGEIFAPNYRDGEEVVLIRYPHGGIFEIPTLRVNNKNKEGKKLIGSDAVDAVGINAKTAAILSGADFDGDTVLVIPNETTGKKRIQTAPPLESLKNFDPHVQYRGYDGMTQLSKTRAQTEMGKVTNLINDMTIMGAPHSEIAKAVKHSMVVIDANKHGLDWKRSEDENNIKALKKQYQGGVAAGASTLISRATSPEYVNQRAPRRASEGGPIDPKTGERMWTETGRTGFSRKVNARTGEVTYTEVPKKVESTKLAEARDARSLMSSRTGEAIERVYADHSNALKGLANNARKAIYTTKNIPYSPSARKTYAKEVAELNNSLVLAQRHAPLERRAQRIATTVVTAYKKDNPDVDSSRLKKITNQALADQRARHGAKPQVPVTPRQWEAIQAGAVTVNMLTNILQHADLDTIKGYATPRKGRALSPTMLARARAMLGREGTTQAEVAQALGVSVSTLNTALREGV